MQTRLATILSLDVLNKKPIGEQELVGDADIIENICKTNSSCENCSGMKYHFKNSLPGCSYISDLIEKIYEYDRTNKTIKYAVRSFEISSIFETITTGYPNHNGVLNSLNQLRLSLKPETQSEAEIIESYSELESTTRIPRKALELF